MVGFTLPRLEFNTAFSLLYPRQGCTVRWDDAVLGNDAILLAAADQFPRKEYQRL